MMKFTRLYDQLLMRLAAKREAAYYIGDKAALARLEYFIWKARGKYYHARRLGR